MLSLEDGEADVAIRSGEHLGGDTLIARKLFDHPWGFYASQNYVQKRGRPDNYDALGSHDLVAYRGFPEEAVTAVRDAQLKFPQDNVKLHTPSLRALKLAVVPKTFNTCEEEIPRLRGRVTRQQHLRLCAQRVLVRPGFVVLVDQL